MKTILLLITLTICTFNVQSQTSNTGVLNTDSLLLKKKVFDLEQQVNTLNKMVEIITKNQETNFTVLKERNKTSEVLLFIGLGAIAAGVIKHEYDRDRMKDDLVYKPDDSSPILLYGGGIFLTATLILDLNNLKWVTTNYKYVKKIHSQPYYIIDNSY